MGFPEPLLEHNGSLPARPAGTVRGGSVAPAEVGQERKRSQFQSLGTLLERFAMEDKGGRISREFQDYAYRLAVDLNDMAHKSLYMRLAKSTDRRLLDQARSFVLDANATSRAKLFMWKLSQLRKEAKLRAERSKPASDKKESV